MNRLPRTASLLVSQQQLSHCRTRLLFPPPRLFRTRRLSNTTTTTTTTTTTKSTTSYPTDAAGPYGLRKVDYSKPPQRWKMPALPPLRGGTPKTKLRPFLIALSIGTFLAGFAYAVLVQDDEIQEYWKQVEQGNVPLDDEALFGDDDEEDNDEWEDEE